jgi:predicted RNase H-like HicB family nuclease
MRGLGGTLALMKEIIFEVREDEVDGGYNASALGVGIHTEGDTLEELRVNVKEAVDCFFDETMEAPKVIRLHFVRDEVLTR